MGGGAKPSSAGTFRQETWQPSLRVGEASNRKPLRFASSHCLSGSPCFQPRQRQRTPWAPAPGTKTPLQISGKPPLRRPEHPSIRLQTAARQEERPACGEEAERHRVRFGHAADKNSPCDKWFVILTVRTPGLSKQAITTPGVRSGRLPGGRHRRSRVHRTDRPARPGQLRVILRRSERPR